MRCSRPLLHATDCGLTGAFLGLFAGGLLIAESVAVLFFLLPCCLGYRLLGGLDR